MDVSIIIVNYNTEKLILDCLDSIYNNTNGFDFEVIVVDNNSPNKPNFLEKDQRIKYIQSEKNLGFGKANNLGAEYAIGKYLLFLNPDTIVLENAITILYEQISKDSTIGICGGNLLSNEMDETHSYYMIPPGIWNEIIILFKLDSLNPQYNHTQEIIDVEYITGADLMIRKDLFNEIGGFDKDFFMYFEETYLCYRIRLLGYRVVNIPQSHIIHLEGKSFKINKYREQLYYASRKTYLIKRYNSLYYYICNIIHLTTCLSRMILFAWKKDKFNMWFCRFKLLFN